MRAAGVPFEKMPPAVDETTVKEAMLAEQATPAHIAELLAELKAMRKSLKQANDSSSRRRRREAALKAELAKRGASNDDDDGM